jgi:hypothetical protein
VRKSHQSPAQVGKLTDQDTFVRLAHNGIWQPPLSFIRYVFLSMHPISQLVPNNTRSNNTSPFQEIPDLPKHSGYRGWTFPTFPSDNPNSVRCGRGNMDWAAATDVLKVNAGDTMEFIVTGAPLEPRFWDDRNLVQWDDCPDGRGACNTRSDDPFKVCLQYVARLTHG